MSDPTKIPRADAKLKRLSEEMQAHIVEMCKKPGVSQRMVLDWIERECDVKSSAASLSEFLSWYQARLEAKADEQRVSVFLDEERQLRPDISKDELFERGQRMFSLLAMSRQDPLAWWRIQRAGMLRETTDLERQKFQRDTVTLFLKWWEDKRAMEIASSPASTADKTEQLGQHIFGDFWQ